MVDLERRALLVGAAATVAALRLGASALAAPAVRRAPLPADPFTLGVASGDPAADGFVLWTRLAPDPLNGGGMPPDPVAVTWEVAVDAAFATVEATGTVNAVADLAHTVHVEVDGLDPGHAPTGTGSRWRAGTAPSGRVAHARRRARRRAAVRLRVLPELRQRLLHRAGRAGRRRSATCGCTWATTSTRTPVAARPGRTVPTSASRSTQYRAPLRALQDRSRPPGGPPRRAGGPRVGRPRGRQQLRRSWTTPAARPATAPGSSTCRCACPRPTGRALQIYRGFQWGDLASFHMLDVRQYRDPAPCGGGLADCPERLGEDRTHARVPSSRPGSQAGLATSRRGLGRGRSAGGVQPAALRGRSTTTISGTATRSSGTGCGRCFGERPNPVIVTGDIHAAGVAALHQTLGDVTHPADRHRAGRHVDVVAVRRGAHRRRRGAHQRPALHRVRQRRGPRLHGRRPHPRPDAWPPSRW